MKIGEAFVELQMKADQVTKELDNLEKAGAKAAKGVQASVDKAADESAKRAKDVGQKLKEYLGAAAFGAAIGGSIKAASDLNEAVNVTGLIFKDSRGEIDEFVKSSAKLVGMSETVARTTTANFAGFLQNVGFAEKKSADLSIQLTKLAADLGSAFNKDPADAALALQSALRGEQEPIRQFNVSLSESALKIEAVKLGLDATGPTLSANVRAQAALSLIMQQTSKVQGDFVNTSDQLANSQRIAKAEAENAAASLGSAFLPIYKTAVQVVGALAKGFGELPQPVQLAVVAILGLVALAGPIKDVIEAAKALKAAIVAFEFTPQIAAFAALAAVAALVVGALTAHANAQKAASERASTLVAALVSVTTSVKDQTTVLGNANLSLDEYATKLRNAALAGLQKTLTDKKQIDDLGRLGLTLDQLAPLFGGQAEAEKLLTDVRERAIRTGEVQIKSTDNLTLSTENLKRLTDDYIKTGQIHTELLQQNGRDVVAVVTGNTDLISTLGQMATASTTASKTLLDLAVAGDENAAATLRASDAFKALTPYQQAQVQGALDVARANKTAAAALGTGPGGLGAAADAAAPKVAEITQKIKPLASATDEAANAGKALKTALDQAFGNPASFDAALSNYLEKLQGLGKALAENGKTLDITTEKGRANRQLIRDTTQAALDYTQAQVAQGLPVSEAKKTLDEYVGSLRTQLTALGLNTAQIDEYVRQLGLTPDNINTAVFLYGDDVAKKHVQDLLESYKGIPAEEQTKIQALIDEGKYAEAERRLDILTKPLTIDVGVRLNSEILSGAQDALSQKGPRAEGGDVRAGVPYRVGERGAELFVPDTKGTVLTAEQTRLLGGSSGTVDASVTINGNVYGVDDLQALLDERDRKLQRALLAGRR